MAIIENFPNNSDEYIGAESVMRWLHGRTAGVFGADENLRVSAVSGEMAVRISDGYGWVSNADGNGSVFWNETEAKTGKKLTEQAPFADAVLDRIDRVVVSWETTDYTRKPEIVFLVGTPAVKPIPPPLINNALKRQISLARINVPAGMSAITDAAIGDERLDETVCGITTGGVKIPTDGVNAQATALIGQLQEELAAANANALYAIVITDTLTLPATGWSATAPYTQTVPAPHMAALYEPLADVALSGTPAQKAAQLEAWACVSELVTGSGTVTVTCFEDKPAVALSARLKAVV